MTVSCAPSLPATLHSSAATGLANSSTRWLTNISQFGKVAQSSEDNFAALLFFVFLMFHSCLPSLSQNFGNTGLLLP